MHYKNEERSMKAIVVEAKSIVRRTIANEIEILELAGVRCEPFQSGPGSS